MPIREPHAGDEFDVSKASHCTQHAGDCPRNDSVLHIGSQRCMWQRLRKVFHVLEGGRGQILRSAQLGRHSAGKAGALPTRGRTSKPLASAHREAAQPNACLVPAGGLKPADGSRGGATGTSVVRPRQTVVGGEICAMVDQDAHREWRSSSQRLRLSSLTVPGCRPAFAAVKRHVTPLRVTWRRLRPK